MDLKSPQTVDLSSPNIHCIFDFDSTRILFHQTLRTSLKLGLNLFCQVKFYPLNCVPMTDALRVVNNIYNQCGIVKQQNLVCIYSQCCQTELNALGAYSVGLCTVICKYLFAGGPIRIFQAAYCTMQITYWRFSVSFNTLCI